MRGDKVRVVTCHVPSQQMGAAFAGLAFAQLPLETAPRFSLCGVVGEVDSLPLRAAKWHCPLPWLRRLIQGRAHDPLVGTYAATRERGEAGGSGISSQAPPC